MGDVEDNFLFDALNQLESNDTDNGRNERKRQEEESTLSDKIQLLQVTQDSIVACSILQQTMGNMALCRGKNGKDLFAAGAVEALHALLEAHTMDRIEVTLLTLGAVRDLACGNADVRSGLHGSLPLLYNILLAASGNDCYGGEPFEVFPDFAEQASALPLITSVLSALRNLSHSHRPNCTKLHELGLTKFLVETVLERPPPVAGLPTRQAYFRASGILLNMAEKCDAAVSTVATVLDHLLLVHHQKVLHPGMLRLIEYNGDPDKYSHLLASDARKRQNDRERQLQRSRPDED